MNHARVLSASLGFTLLACSGEAPSDGSLRAVASRGPGHIMRMKGRIPDEYIVKLKPGVVAAQTADVHAVADDFAGKHRGSKKHVFHSALQGFSMRMSEGDALALSQDSRVEVVEENARVEAYAVQSNAPWGLDRIDQAALPLDTKYDNRGLDGQGVTVYVIDSGIRASHVEFEGRATVGTDFVGDGRNGQDAVGHGTHVAATIAGKTFGVAKKARIVAVRVLDENNGAFLDTLIAGIDWVTANHAPGAIANMSIGGGASAIEDAAVRNSISSGVVYVVAAGNAPPDWPPTDGLGSPARVAEALVVGAIGPGDVAAGFSNFGAGLDLWAPGVDVESAYNFSDTATLLASGTSMAAPHVAGLAALFRQAMPTATPVAIHDAIIGAATPVTIAGAGPSSPDRVAYIGNDVITKLTSDFEIDASGWTVVDGTWAVVSDGSKVYQGTNTAGYARATALSAMPDQVIQARVKPVSFNGTDRYAMIMGRYSDTSNYYFLSLRNSNRVDIRRVRSGTVTTLASTNYTITAGTWYTVKLEIVGTALRGYVNGSLLVAATDSGLSTGKVGLGSMYAQTRFDDVRVTLPGTGTNSATRPYPVAGATAVDPHVVLAWTSGADALSHDVYFSSTSWPPDFVANVNVPHYSVGQLANNTTYYWRVDERTSTGAVVQGPVWSFTTGLAPGKATSPSPWHGAGNVPRGDLHWVAGDNATYHEVYFGTTNPPMYLGQQPPEQGTTIPANVLPLQPFTTYYWRIDEGNADFTTPGDVWTFSTGSWSDWSDLTGYPTNPSPGDGALNVNPLATLSWTPAPGGGSQSFYLMAVIDYYHTFPVSGTLPTGSYTPPKPLFCNTDYEWWIYLTTGYSWASPVWSFRTGTPNGAPGFATITSPANGDYGVGLNPTITWTAATGATSYDLYVCPASHGNPFCHSENPYTTTGTSYTLPTLTPDMSYYVTVVARNSVCGVRGSHIQFSTIVDSLVAPPSSAASNPSPANGATTATSTPVLSWTLGAGADFGALYVGPSSTDLQFVDEETDVHIARDLAPNQRYYWRVDSVNRGGRVRGPVWSFTTGPRALPGAPSNPTPGPDAYDIMPPSVDLSWTEGVGTTKAYVYFGTSSDPPLLRTLSPSSSEPGSSSHCFVTNLNANTTYFWRVVEKNQAGSTAGDLWSFTTTRRQPGEITNPTPADGANFVSPTLTLSWDSTEGAVDYTVLLAPAGSDLVVVSGNQTGTSYIPPALQTFTAYHWMVVAYNATGYTSSQEWTFITGGANTPAFSPSPAVGTTGVGTLPTLSWIGGLGAASHLVYLGFDQPPFMQYLTTNRADNTQLFPRPLLDNTTYYWTVDEVDPAGLELWPDTLWYFTTGTSNDLAGLPSDPRPPNNATGYGIRPTFTWTPGAGTTRHHVYLAMNYPHAAPNEFVQSDGLPVIPGYLQPNTPYWWFVGEENASGIRRGPTWFFTTGSSETNIPGAASNPSPLDLATGVSTSPTLTWTAGSDAASHDVYFGTSNPPALVRNQASTSYQPSPALSAGTTYYWRVDERNAAGVTTGQVWRFTTAASVTLFSDDFEDGNSNGWSVLSNTWSMVRDGTWVYQGASSTGDARTSAGSSTWANQTITARIKPVSFSGTNRFVALFGRLRDASNYYYVALRSNNTLELKKLVGGASTTLAVKSMTVSTGTWYTVKLEIIGTSLKVYINGTQQVSATDSTFSTGKIGLGTYYATARFDDILVTR